MPDIETVIADFNAGRADRDPYDEIAALIAEVERLRREGSPGVMHKTDRAFYDLTVTERDYERRRVDQLKTRLLAVYETLETVDLASPGRMVIEVSLVREAANTGRVPDLPKRAKLI